jgi:hypothetical protein
MIWHTVSGHAYLVHLIRPCRLTPAEGCLVDVHPQRWGGPARVELVVDEGGDACTVSKVCQSTVGNCVDRTTR